MTTETLTKSERQREALTRAATGLSAANYTAIFQGFEARGIDPADIKPRENVFTYAAWQALGRQVRRGEHGVRIVSFVPMTKRDRETGETVSIGRRPKGGSVFHISQTDPK